LNLLEATTGAGCALALEVHVVRDRRLAPSVKTTFPFAGTTPGDHHKLGASAGSVAGVAGSFAVHVGGVTGVSPGVEVTLSIALRAGSVGHVAVGALLKRNGGFSKFLCTVCSSLGKEHNKEVF